MSSETERWQRGTNVIPGCTFLPWIIPVAEPLHSVLVLCDCLSQIHKDPHRNSHHCHRNRSPAGPRGICPGALLAECHSCSNSCFGCGRKCSRGRHTEQVQGGHFAAVFSCSPIDRISAHLEDLCKEPVYSSAYHCQSPNTERSWS